MSSWRLFNVFGHELLVRPLQKYLSLCCPLYLRHWSHLKTDQIDWFGETQSLWCRLSYMMKLSEFDNDSNHHNIRISRKTINIIKVRLNTSIRKLMINIRLNTSVRKWMIHIRIFTRISNKMTHLVQQQEVLLRRFSLIIFEAVLLT